MFRILFYKLYDYMVCTKCDHIDLPVSAHKDIYEKGHCRVWLKHTYLDGEIVKINGVGYMQVKNISMECPRGKLYELHPHLLIP